MGDVNSERPAVDRKLDKKFYGTIYKVKNGQRAPDDEWLVFLAKDTAFAEGALPAYLEKCVELGCDDVQLEKVRQMIANVNAWREAFPERCKVPDAAGEKILP